MHQVVPRYELGEIRLRSETFVQNLGIAPTADLLLKVARTDVPSSVTCEDDAMNRIDAFMLALEYVGQLAIPRFSRPARDSAPAAPLLI